LREIADFPSVVYHLGPANFWRVLPIAIVGTRQITAYGQRATQVITGELIDCGATIISGFMYGVDLVSHTTAIKKNGKSVAVLGYGFEYLPTENEEYPTELFLEKGNTF